MLENAQKHPKRPQCPKTSKKSDFFQVRDHPAPILHILRPVRGRTSGLTTLFFFNLTNCSHQQYVIVKSILSKQIQPLANNNSNIVLAYE